MTVLGRHTLVPRAVRGCVDENALAVTRHAPLGILPVCGLIAPGRILLTATGTAECACALGVTARCLDDCSRDRLAVARPGGSHYRSRDRRWSSDRSPSSDHSLSG